MPFSGRHRAIIAVLLLAAAITVPAHARRNCTNTELRRISDAWIIDCTAKPGFVVKCQDNGDPECCYNTPWGTKCTTNPGASSFDPGSGPVRPPRAGTANPPPSSVGPGTSVPPRMIDNPDRAGQPTAPAKTPR